MRLLTPTTLGCLLLIGSLTSGPASAQKAEAVRKMEAFRAQRQASAVAMHLAGPHYSVSDDFEATLLLINKTAYPIDLELSVVAPGGEILPLGLYYAESSLSLEISLNEVLQGHEAVYGEGSLSLRYLGDADSLQGWVVLRRGPQIVELPLQAAQPGATQRLTSFWTAGTEELHQVSRPVPRYFLLNAGDLPLAYFINIGDGNSKRTRISGNLQPGERQTISPVSATGLRKGWVSIESRGSDATLLAAGLLEGASFLGRLSLVSHAKLAEGVEYQTIRAPQPTRGTLGVYNPTNVPQRIELEFLDQVSGDLLGTRALSLGAREVRSYSLRDLLPATGSENLRIALQGERPFLVTGYSRAATSEVLDFEFFAVANAHHSGLYPLPELERHDVFTTWVNLGDEPARIGVQLTWDSGTYAYGPVTIPANGSYRIDVRQVAEDATPDLLGRRLDPAYGNGFLQWTALAGSGELIARTEARPLTGGADTFGFNCGSCCFQSPYGSVVPSSVSFLPGETPSFLSCVTVETCSGTQGPWFTQANQIFTRGPFDWNGQTVGATGGGSETLEFLGEGPVTAQFCQIAYVPISGSGPADTCKKLCNPDFDRAKTCATQTPSQCDICYACCNAVYGEWSCEGKAHSIIRSQYNSCIVGCQTSKSGCDPLIPDPQSCS